MRRRNGLATPRPFITRLPARGGSTISSSHRRPKDRAVTPMVWSKSLPSISEVADSPAASTSRAADSRARPVSAGCFQPYRGLRTSRTCPACATPARTDLPGSARRYLRIYAAKHHRGRMGRHLRRRPVDDIAIHHIPHAIRREGNRRRPAGGRGRSRGHQERDRAGRRHCGRAGPGTARASCGPGNTRPPDTAR